MDILLHRLQGIEKNELVELPGIYLFSVDNPLAKKPDLKPADFKDDIFYAINMDTLLKTNIKFCQSQGYEPNVKKLPNNDSILAALSNGNGYALFHLWSYYKDNKNFSYIKTEEVIPISLAWKSNNKNTLVNIFANEMLFWFEQKKDELI